MSLDIKSLVPEAIKNIPLHDRILTIFQHVYDTYGEDKLQDIFLFYNPQTIPDIDRLLNQFGVREMVDAIVADGDEQTKRNLAGAIKTLLSIKGTVRAINYVISASDMPATTEFTEWHEPGFSPDPGDSIGDYEGTIQVTFPGGSDLTDIDNKIQHFEQIAPHLFPWFMRVYQWIFEIEIEDTNPDVTDSFEAAIVIPIEENFSINGCEHTYWDGTYIADGTIDSSGNVCPPVEYDGSHEYDGDIDYLGFVPGPNPIFDGLEVTVEN